MKTSNSVVVNERFNNSVVVNERLSDSLTVYKLSTSVYIFFIVYDF